MTLIGENLHIISPTVKSAIIKRDSTFVLDLIKRQKEAGIQVVDLNIGPAKGELKNSMAWLIDLIQEEYELDFSLDSTNLEELQNGFKILKNPTNAFLNSTSANPEKLDKRTDLISEYNANLIALTMNAEGGIPKSSDERLALAFEILEVANQKGIDNSKIYFDPLILPVCVEQKQASVALETIRMLKESFEPSVKTLVGLSNISNGAPREKRALINRVFLVLALGYGLDCAIADSFDSKLIDIYDKIKTNKCETEEDKMYYSLFECAQTFDDIENIKYDKSNTVCNNIYKTAQIILNKEVYTHSYTEV